MDWNVYEDTRISRLPRALRWPALAARNLGAGRDVVRYRYQADGLATAYHCPFDDDREFAAHYAALAATWYPGTRPDVRWRMWILTSLARTCSGLPGDHAEFGTYRGGCAYMLLATGAVGAEQRLHLFDTFAGIPIDQLSPAEAQLGLGERYHDASVAHVQERLRRWAPSVVLWPGDVLETVPAPAIASLAFAHVDLNAAAPTAHVLEWAWPALVSGGIVVFDDYGDPTFQEQRRVVDEHFSRTQETLVALPTGQAFAVKRSMLDLVSSPTLEPEPRGGGHRRPGAHDESSAA
jgi:O-methyltransferase